MENQTTAEPYQGCAPREPQILQLRPDRRLGHEWDDWDGNPVPDGGIYHEPPGLFFKLFGSWLLAWGLVLALGLWLIGPRLGTIWAPAPLILWSILGLTAISAIIWMIALAVALGTNRNSIPVRLAEGGLLPRLMPLAERSARWFGISRDRAGNAALRVYNGLATARARPGLRPDEILLLLPRCLDKAGMQGVMGVSARYGVPLFVAARGRYAREMIVRTRPKAVVAIACERDLVSGIHDVATKLPVLGTTLGLPDGPCKNTTVDLGSLEVRIRTFLGLDGAGTR